MTISHQRAAVVWEHIDDDRFVLNTPRGGARTSLEPTRFDGGPAMTSRLNPSATLLDRIEWEADPVIEIDHSQRAEFGSFRLLRTILALPRRWQQRVQERRHLSGLSDSLLADIGLTRDEVEREASKPFWRPVEPRRMELWRPVEPPRTGASLR